MEPVDALNLPGSPDTVLATAPVSDKTSSVSDIYKICSVAAWREAERSGVFAGSEDDRRDGYIHFSTAAQLAQTLRKHFAGQHGLLLVAVDPEALGGALRWEPSRGGDLFPHLYGPLPVAAASGVVSLATDSDGNPMLAESYS
jgi:uncharacterized protein (DUF952 family)